MQRLFDTLRNFAFLFSLSFLISNWVYYPRLVISGRKGIESNWAVPVTRIYLIIDETPRLRAWVIICWELFLYARPAPVYIPVFFVLVWFWFFVWHGICIDLVDSMTYTAILTDNIIADKAALHRCMDSPAFPGHINRITTRLG